MSPLLFKIKLWWAKRTNTMHLLHAEHIAECLSLIGVKNPTLASLTARRIKEAMSKKPDSMAEFIDQMHEASRIVTEAMAQEYKRLGYGELIDE